MKSSLVVLLSFLLLSLLPNPLMARNREPIYDSSGDKVVTGTRYHLLPAFEGDGGGFYTTNPSCPGDVFQFAGSSPAQPVVFRPVNYTEAGSVIYEDTYFYIYFPSQVCRLFPNAWTVFPTGTILITNTASPVSQPQIWFQFEKLNLGGNFLLFNPPVCESCPTLPSGYVGITYNQLVRRPALTNSRPIRFNIVKASGVQQVKEATSTLNNANIASVV